MTGNWIQYYVQRTENKYIKYDEIGQNPEYYVLH